MSNSLRPHEPQHARPPCPSLVYPNSCLLSQWCHPTISSSVVPLSCPQSFPASGSFQMNLGVYKYSDTGIKCELPLEKERVYTIKPQKGLIDPKKEWICLRKRWKQALENQEPRSCPLWPSDPLSFCMCMSFSFLILIGAFYASVCIANTAMAPGREHLVA